MNDEKIKTVLEQLASKSVPGDVRKLSEQICRDFINKKHGTESHFLWSDIMRSRITKLAAAAVIMIAVLFGIGRFFSGTVTFAQVIEPILKARTVVFDFTNGNSEDSPVIRDIVVGNRIRRTMSNMNLVMIIDVDNAKMLTMNPDSKTAFYTDIQGLIQQGTRNILGIVRNVVSDIKDHPEQAERLGRQMIDGKETVGFLVRGQNEEVVVWADAATARPVQIELTFGGLSVTITNIEFDVPVNESLVSMEPPADYSLESMEYNMTQFTEQDFVESLRIWAEIVRDGTFPETLSPDSYMKAVPLLGQKLGQSGLSKEEGTRLGMTFGRGLMFFQVTAVESSDWYYAGNGVKLGEADKPVFWYQPKDSQNYRVIYGDLSVKDVSPQDLPK
jgi:hypothetical protein